MPGSRRLTVAVVALLSGVALGAGATQTARSEGQLDRTALLRDAEILAADAMEGRQAGTAGGARARAYLVGRFAASGLQPFEGSYEHPFDFRQGGAGRQGSRQGVNVVGWIAGSRQPDRYLVVSAHYDHVGVREGQVYNGADDNASGTAALLALAAHFRARPPEHSLIFAAFDAEEAGLQGSRAFVANPPVPRGAIAVNVNLDMIGRDRDNRLFVVGTRQNPSLRTLLAGVAAEAPVRVLFGHDDPAAVGAENWSRASDHWSFQQAGIPALLLSVEDYEHHHEPTDDYETMTFDFFVNAAETSLLIVKRLDGNLASLAYPSSVGYR